MTKAEMINRSRKRQEANSFLASRRSFIDQAKKDLQAIVNKDYGSGFTTSIIIKNLKPTVQVKIESILEKEYKYLANCYVLDQYINDINERVQDLQTRKVGKKLKPFEDIVLFQLKQKRASFEVKFAQRNCKSYFEAVKQKENVDILGGGFDITDKDVLGQSKKTQTALLVGGGVALLIGLYIALK